MTNPFNSLVLVGLLRLRLCLFNGKQFEFPFDYHVDWLQKEGISSIFYDTHRHTTVCALCIQDSLFFFWIYSLKSNDLMNKYCH